MKNTLKEIKEIKTRIIPSDSIGLFHDSRQDVRNLAKLLNICVDKINELVEENNKLKILIESK